MRRLFPLVLPLFVFLMVAHTVSGQTPNPTPPAPPPPPPGGTPPTLAPPCPPPPYPCGPTATPTLTATPTATPTPSPTPIPLTLFVKLSEKTARPGSTEKVSVQTLPGAAVTVSIHFPNGDTKSHKGTAATTGKLSYSYKQPGSRITRTSRTAAVMVTAALGTQTTSATKKYSIAFANVDVSIQPRNQKRGRAVHIYLHSYANAVLVLVQMHFHGGRSATVQGHVGSDGWWSTRYVVPTNVKKGRADVKGWAVFTKPNRKYSGLTSFQVK